MRSRLIRIGALSLELLLVYTLASCWADSPKEETKRVRRPGDPDPAHFLVRVSPVTNLVPAPTLLIVAEHKGELVEAEYCVGVRIEFGEGQASSHQQDCPSWEEYQKQLAAWDECSQRVVVVPPGFEGSYNCSPPHDLTRRWSWRPAQQFRVGYGPGHHELTVVFYLPNGKTIRKMASFYVGGGEE